MFHIPETILPIFSIILLGIFLRQKGGMDPAFAKTANQIVYYVAIPAMLLSTITEAPFRENFHPAAVLSLVGAILVQAGLSMATARVLAVPVQQQGTFLQSSFHGNLGYMAYAIAYYALGREEFARTAIMSSFLMVAQNLLAVWTLIAFATDRRVSHGKQGTVIVKAILRNPIIMAMIVSMLYAACELPMPAPLKRGLQILSGMALPAALLLIGASLSFSTVRLRRKEIAVIGLLKLICFPLLGFLVMKLAAVPDFFILPGIILLGAPPATVAYVMAAELGGDCELAASSISILTLASALSYSLLLLLFV